MNWRKPHEEIVPVYSGMEVHPVFYDEIAGTHQETGDLKPLLVIARTLDVDFDEFVDTLNDWKPYAVVPPFDTTRTTYTSRCAERARSYIKESFVGVVVTGNTSSERLDFTVWAQEQGYSPLVLLPHAQKTRSRQINEYNMQGYLWDRTWMHLAGKNEPSLDTSYFKGIFTLGEELWP